MTEGQPASQLPGVGTVAPDFTLPSSSREPVTLSSFRGRSNVLLAFFPLAFTSTCTAELCDFTTDFSQFASAETAVLGISVDSYATLAEFKQRHHMPFELLSDFRRDVSERYGVMNAEKFYSNRAYVVIDREGLVRWTWMESRNNDRRDNAALLEVLRTLA